MRLQLRGTEHTAPEYPMGNARLLLEKDRKEWKKPTHGSNILDMISSKAGSNFH